MFTSRLVSTAQIECVRGSILEMLNCNKVIWVSNRDRVQYHFLLFLPCEFLWSPVEGKVDGRLLGFKQVAPLIGCRFHEQRFEKALKWMVKQRWERMSILLGIDIAR